MPTYYVATSGNNGNSGTLSSPWKDWYYGIGRLSAGDTLYIRSGTYTAMQGAGGGNYSGVNISAKNGTAILPITVSSYPGEARPVLDCSALSSIAGYHRGIRFVDSSYWNFYGLIIANVREYSSSPTTYTGSAWECQDISNVNIENCVVTGCMNGFSVSTHIVNLNYINCDAYDNWDIYQAGDLCNGFNGNANAGSTITFTGCRAWRNSDDGFDYLGGSGTITNRNCWAFNNGPWHGGDGSGNGAGFKLAQSSIAGGYRYMYNCISANNHSLGIEAQVDAGYAFTMGFYNNISANNGDYCGFRLPVYAIYGVSTARNNISYGNSTLYSGGAHNVVDHNNWNLAVTASDADFASVSITQLSAARGTYGALPTITAFHLVASSDLIGVGTATGIYPTDGEGSAWDSPPSLGPYKYGVITGHISLTIEGENYVNASTGDYTAFDITRDDPTDLTFRNNMVSMAVGAGSLGYWLMAGDETRGVDANNLDGAIITGNKFIWTGVTNVGQHGIFVGFNINDVIRYNYLYKVPYGAVIKSNGVAGVNMAYTSGGFAYNIVKDSDIGVRIKGMDGVLVYNNTFYNTINNNPPAIIYITANADTGDGSPSINTKIKNNIFYSTNGIRFIYVESGCEAGFDSDYNIFYCSSGAPSFQLGVTTYTFAQWQALGYDLHSQVLNPNFIDTTNFVPAARLNYGVNLGTTWQTGLSVIAKWVVGTTPATTDQNGTWQVGARIYGTGSIPVTAVTVVGEGSNTVITTPGGTLQMYAHCDPHDATDQTVVWSVINGTGSATISASGLLTAVSDGTVTVKAVSNG